MSQAEVIAVCRDGLHRFSKAPVDRITLIEGLGVEGDAHAGTRVQHRSRVRRNPDQPNLRQVHLLHRELFDDARDQGYVLAPGDLGENILTEGLDILSLPEGGGDVGGPAGWLGQRGRPDHRKTPAGATSPPGARLIEAAWPPARDRAAPFP